MRKTKLYNKWTFLVFAILLVIIFVSFINIFPQDYIFSGGDVTQSLNLKENFGKFFYSWDEQLGGHFVQYQSYFLYYIPFYFLTIWGIPEFLQSFLFYFLFLGLSFLSCYLALQYLSGENTNDIKLKIILTSTLYTFNPYTLYVFTYTWGFSPFLFLYLTIPLIFAWTYCYFLSPKLIGKEIAYLGIVFFLTNIAFGNMAFLIALGIFLLIYLIFLFLFYSEISKKIFKCLIYVTTFGLSTFLSIIPQIPEMVNQYSIITDPNAIFGLNAWILFSRLDILSLFYLTPDIINTLNIFSFVTVIFLLGCVLLFCISMYHKNVNKLFTIFLLLSLISIFITIKGQGIFSDNLSLKIFTLPGLNSLRSFDKSFVFLPFFLLSGIFMGISKIRGKKVSICVIFVCLITLSGVYPFFTGGIQKEYSYAFDKNTNYTTSEYSYLIKIPDSYYLAANQVNQDSSQNKILHLPYSVINSVGWVNYPKWKVIGTDPTDHLFNKPSIQPNAYNSFNFNYGDEWNSGFLLIDEGMLKFMSITNVKYIIYHKDVDIQFILKTVDKIEYLKGAGYLSLMQSNDYFDLYALSDEYLLPCIYSADTFVLAKDMESTFEYMGSNNFSPEDTVIFTSNRLNNMQITYLNDRAPTKEYYTFKNKSTAITTGPIWEVTDQYKDDGEVIYYANILENSSTSHPSSKISDTQKNIINCSEITPPTITFQKVNPTKYEARINTTQSFFLVFSDSYNPQWKAYVENNPVFMNEIIANYSNVNVQEAKQEMQFTPQDISYLFADSLPEENHFLVNGYANAWYIDPAQLPKDSEGNIIITLYFWPQSLFYLGLIISGSTLIICIGYLVYDWRRRKSGNKNH